MEEKIAMQNMPQQETENVETPQIDAQNAPEAPINEVPTEAPITEPVTEETIHEEPAMEEPIAETIAEPVEEPVMEESAMKPIVDEPITEPIQEAVEEPMAEEEKKETFQEPEANYDTLTREQLIDTLQELLDNNDVMQIRNRANAIRNRFNDLNQELHQAQFEAFLQEGGDKANYEQRNDDTAQSFYKLFDTYRTKRQQVINAQEAEKQANFDKKNELIATLRQLAETTEQVTLKELHNRFNDIQARWKEIGEVPRNEAHTQWQTYHLWADQLFAKIKLERESIMEDMKRNLEKKLQLCEQVEEQSLSDNTANAFRKLQDLRAAWKQIGPVPQEQNETIWHRFQDAAERISIRHKEAIAARQEAQQQNLLAKRALIEKATELTATLPTGGNAWKTLGDQLDELLALWKTIGPVAKEESDAIWKEFITIRDTAFKARKKFFETQRQERDAARKTKLALCEKAEQIAEREDLREATTELLHLQAEWKKSGTLHRDESEQLWKRFRAACDKFFARKSERYEETHQDEGENLTNKQPLLEALKQLTLGDDRNENLARLKDIQRRWSEIGFVPRKEKDRLQQTFRDTINAHFNQLKLSAQEAEETAFKARVQRHAGDMRFARNERNALLDKIERQRNDIKTLENNIGFFSNSKNAAVLQEEVTRKIQHARQQLALLENKLRILDTAPQEPVQTPDNGNPVAGETDIQAE